MCEICDGICRIFDALVSEYYRDFPPISEEEERNRPKYMPLDVRNAPKAAASFTALKDLLDRAGDIGFRGWQFKAELVKRSGYGEWIDSWTNGKVPNGLVRKIILSCAEDIIRERGAQPSLSLKAA